MFKIIFGVFVVLHGLVHLLYLGQSVRIFEMQPGMVWPDGAWLLSKFWAVQTVRGATAVGLVLAAAGFIAGGVGLLWQQAWWRPVLVGAALFSSVLYLLLWDGAWQNLDDKGGVGLLINVALLTAVLLFNWPAVN